MPGYTFSQKIFSASLALASSNWSALQGAQVATRNSQIVFFIAIILFFSCQIYVIAYLYARLVILAKIIKLHACASLLKYHHVYITSVVGIFTPQNVKILIRISVPSQLRSCFVVEKLAVTDRTFCNEGITNR